MCARSSRPACCNLVCGDRDTGAALAAHPIPQMVSITGATRAGMAVATAAANDVKRVPPRARRKGAGRWCSTTRTSPAAEDITVAGYFNAGQDCTAATRVLAGARVHDEFVAALDRAAKAHARRARPADEDILYGPLNNANQLGHVGGLVDRAPDHAQVARRAARGGRTAATSTRRPRSPTSSRTTSWPGPRCSGR